MNTVLISDRHLCRIATLTALALGPIGMLVSLLFLDSALGADVVAGVAGLLAGAVLTAAGVVSLAVIVRSR